MLPRRVVLIDDSGTVPASDLAQAAAAFTVQIGRDLAAFWPVTATVETLPRAAAIPPGAWPVRLVADLPPDEGGFHLDHNNQPYAKVASGDGWQVAASHELLEMLVDPGGNMTHAARGVTVIDGQVQDTDEQVLYLVEVSDPSEDPSYGYEIEGVTVSDFITPRFFDDAPAAGIRYSFTGAITAPRRVLRWGYMSWHRPADGAWLQLNHVDHDPPQIEPMRVVTDVVSLRQRSDRSLPTHHVRRRVTPR